MNCSKLFRGSLGFGARNLKHIRVFAEAYPDQQFVQQDVAQFGWKVTTDRRNIARGRTKWSTIGAIACGDGQTASLLRVEGVTVCGILRVSHSATCFGSNRTAAPIRKEGMALAAAIL